MRQLAILLLVTFFSSIGLTGCFKGNVNVPDYSGFGRSNEELAPVPQAVPGDLAGCHQEILALRAQNDELRAQNAHFRDRAASLEKKVDKAKDENERLKDENKKLRKLLGND